MWKHCDLIISDGLHFDICFSSNEYKNNLMWLAYNWPYIVRSSFCLWEQIVIIRLFNYDSGNVHVGIKLKLSKPWKNSKLLRFGNTSLKDEPIFRRLGLLSEFDDEASKSSINIKY